MSHVVVRLCQGGKEEGPMGYWKMLQGVSPRVLNIQKVSSLSLQPAGTGVKM